MFHVRGSIRRSVTRRSAALPCSKKPQNTRNLARDAKKEANEAKKRLASYAKSLPKTLLVALLTTILSGCVTSGGKLPRFLVSFKKKRLLPTKRE